MRSRSKWVRFQISCIAGTVLLSLSALCRAQDKSVLAPGDRRVDGRRIVQYARCYEVSEIHRDRQQLDSVIDIGDLEETVQFQVMSSDTSILQVRKLRLASYGVEVESLVVARRSLAPISLVRFQAPTAAVPYQEGFTSRGQLVVHGNRLSHTGVNSSQSVDTSLTSGAFLRGSESLLFEAMSSVRFLGTPLRASIADFDENQLIFEIYEDPIVFRGTDRISAEEVDTVLRVQVGESTFWLDFDSHNPLQWDEPLEESRIIRRFRIKDRCP